MPADALAAFLAALDLAAEGPRDGAGNLTPAGRASVRAALAQAGGTPERFADDGLYHGPTPPGPGWVDAGSGPRGGKVWRYEGEDGNRSESQSGQDGPADKAGLLKRLGGKIRQTAARVADAVNRTAVRFHVAYLAPDILDTIEDTTRIWYRQPPPVPGIPLSAGQWTVIGSHVLGRAALFLKKKIRGHAEGDQRRFTAEELPAVVEALAAAFAELERSFPEMGQTPTREQLEEIVRERYLKPQGQEGGGDAEPFCESHTTSWGHVLRERYGADAAGGHG